MEIDQSESELLHNLSESGDPQARVLYHLSMRVLGIHEMLSNIQREVIYTGGVIRRVERKQAAIASYIDRNLEQKSGSQPKLRAILGIVDSDEPESPDSAGHGGE